MDNTELGLCQKPLEFNCCTCHTNQIRPQLIKIYAKEIWATFLNQTLRLIEILHCVETWE